MIIHATDLLCAARLALQREWERKGDRWEEDSHKMTRGWNERVKRVGKDERGKSEGKRGTKGRRKSHGRAWRGKKRAEGKGGRKISEGREMVDSVRKSGEGRKKERKGRRREGWRRRNHQSEKERERGRERQTDRVCVWSTGLGLRNDACTSVQVRR